MLKSKHVLPYLVVDLITDKIIFISTDKYEIAKYLGINCDWWKTNRDKNRIYKSRYTINKTINKEVKLSQQQKIKLMLKSMGLIPTDFTKPTIQDIEMAYNIYESYGVDECEFWNFINSKFKKLCIDIE